MNSASTMSGRLLLVLLGLLAMQACAPKTNRPWVDPRLAAEEAVIQRDMAARDLSERTARLNRVGAKLLINAAPLCGSATQPFSGLYTMSLDAVDSQWREAFGKLHGLDQRVKVIDVIANTPVAQAGITTGDIIVGLEGREVGEGEKAFKEFAVNLEAAARKGPYSLTIDRQGNRTDVTITPVAACSYPIELVQKDDVNAFADGSRIMVTLGMVRFCEKEEELALVLGHELAHDAMGHIKAKAGNRLGGAVADTLIAVLFGVYNGGVFARQAELAYSHDFEAEADYVGLYFAARAGYDIKDAAYFWRKMAVSHPKSIGQNVTHPSTSFRFAGIEAARAEIENKRALGLPLEPEMQKEGKDKQEKQPGPPVEGIQGISDR